VTRITQNMISRNLLSDLHTTTERLARTQQKMSSGKELTRPSDDPFAVSRALQFRGDLAANRQHQRNVAEAEAWQDVTDTSLGQMGDMVLRARELVVRGATGSAGQTSRDAIATEIEQLIDSLKTVANAQYAGRYVFAGSETLTAPYQLGASDAYAGNTAAIRREIGPNVQIDLNVSGRSVLGDGSSGLIATLRTVVADLRAGDTAALQGGDLAAIDAGHETIVTARATVGARANRLESAAARLADVEDTSSRLLSETEDADMAKTLIDFSMQQAVYQSALKAGANVIQPSLMDFLS
jgi:flagellar hook-associated protein 3 FlgL